MEKLITKFESNATAEDVPFPEGTNREHQEEFMAQKKIIQNIVAQLEQHNIQFVFGFTFPKIHDQLQFHGVTSNAESQFAGYALYTLAELINRENKIEDEAIALADDPSITAQTLGEDAKFDRITAENEGRN